MISLLAIIPSVTDATSFYRSLGPLSHLRRAIPNLLVSVQNRVDWPDMKLADIVFMQRPYGDAEVHIANMAKQLNRPLWIDYDDYLLDVPPCNTAHIYYDSQKTKENIKCLLGMADIVTVTTPYLADKLKLYTNAITVVPNAFDTDFLKLKVDKKPVKKLFWRGTNTHEWDLLGVSRDMRSFLNENPKVECEFMGFNPWFISSFSPNCRFTPPNNLIGYFHHLAKLESGVFVCPLEDNSFNRSKSNIAWIEASFSGSQMIAPAWEEWFRPGCVNYTSAAFFKEQLDHCFSRRENDSAQMSWEFIMDVLTIEKVNKLRQEIVFSLYGG